MWMTLLFCLSWLTLPFYGMVFVWRVVLGREDWRDTFQRLGWSQHVRPPGQIIWIHGVSVGESLATEGLMRTLLNTYPHLFIVLTTSTLSSARMWRAKLTKDTVLGKRVIHQVLPFDHPLFWGLFLKHWRPLCFLLSENDFWPYLFLALKKRGIYSAVLGARMSKKSHNRWHKLKHVTRLMLDQVTCLVPSVAQKNLFKSLGAAHVEVVGSLKWTKCPLFFKPSNIVDALPAQQAFLKDRNLWSAVSTHEGEEVICLKAYQKAVCQYPHIRLALAPRHLNRLKRVIAAVHAQGLSPVLWSQLLAPLGPQDVLIIDQMGYLKTIYGASQIVFVGGSLYSGIGGHDIIDPAGYGCATVCGPFMDNQKEVVECFCDHDAIRITKVDHFYETIDRLLSNHAEIKRLGEAAQTLVKKQHTDVLAAYMAHLQPRLSDCA